MKNFEHLDFKQHWREFYQIYLPIFVFLCSVVLVVWVNFKPKPKKQVIDVDASKLEMYGKRLNGLLNPSDDVKGFDPAFAVLSPIEMVSTPVATLFDPPMGTEHAGLTYNAQPFLTSKHLGDDINGIGGNNSDLGDPVYAVADGRVLYTGWPADGWGNVVILLHELPDGRLVQSFYGHLDKSGVFVGQTVRRGAKIGRVGNANGRYWAHLHFELRSAPSLDCGGGYADAALDRLSGEFSLMKWRGREGELLYSAPEQNPDVDLEESKLGVDTER